MGLVASFCPRLARFARLPPPNTSSPSPDRSRERPRDADSPARPFFHPLILASSAKIIPHARLIRSICTAHFQRSTRARVGLVASFCPRLARFARLPPPNTSSPSPSPSPSLSLTLLPLFSVSTSVLLKLDGLLYKLRIILSESYRLVYSA